MKIHEPRNYSTEYITTKNLLSTWGETRKKNKKIHVSLHICIFIHATRNYKQTTIAHNTTTTPSPPDHHLLYAKAKKKAGELITHHPFVDDVGRTILSHHHQWCSSSRFPTWEVQILEHSPTQQKASLACGPRFRYEQTATTNHSALSSDLLWPNDNTIMHDDPGTVHVVYSIYVVQWQWSVLPCSGGWHCCIMNKHR